MASSFLGDRPARLLSSLRNAVTVGRLRGVALWFYEKVWGGESRRMVVLSASIGLICGLAAAVLIGLLKVCHDAFFSFGDLAPANLWIVAVPALGGAIVGPLVARFAPETRGHGVPEVMLAVAKQGGKIRARVAIVKTIASAITIGSGGSAGREGPIVQIGSAVGSAIGQALREPPEILRTFVACGAAGGIAASFNAPIAGVVFALEVILRNFAARAFAMVVASAVAASIVARSILGKEAFFLAPAHELRSGWEIFLYVILGVLSAWVARLFIKVLYATEDAFDGSRTAVGFRPVIGGFLVGSIGFAVMFLPGMTGPGVFGTGHDAVERALSGNWTIPLLAALLVGKILATSFTLGSGGSGGVFAPSLFMGAMLGGLFGTLAGKLFPEIAGPPGGYAMVGMGAVFSGAAFAPITAILIIFEMTHEYSLILPLMAACVTSVLVSHKMSPDSIYTIKLRRRGINLGDQPPALSGTVSDVMTQDVETIPQALPVSDLVERIRASSHSGFPVVDDKEALVGLVTYAELREALANVADLRAALAVDLMRLRPPTCRPSEALPVVAARMRHQNVDRLPVIAEDGSRRVVGIVTHHDLVAALMKGRTQTGSYPITPAQPPPLGT